MVDFTKAAALAKRLVEANGRLVTLTKLNRTPDSTSLPWEGSSVTAAASAGGDSQDVRMAFVPPTGGFLGAAATNATAEINSRERQVGLVAASSARDIDFSEFDTVLDADEKPWQIDARERLKPAGTDILWALELSR